MSTKIYTKTGDNGKTSLLGGTKVPKSHARIESYGNVDELNSFLGLLGDYVTDKEIRGQLREVQDRLFTIGSTLATDPEKGPGSKIPQLVEEDISFLEKRIDSMNEELPPMKSFILPGGHHVVSTAHICRAVCRRAERSTVALHETGSFVDPLVIKYLNRLSDYFFVLSRFIAKQLKVEEILWMARI
ncbi:MAG: cob(I)yrinic acid a,c-diamide adenosyltransferase [Chitinophagales bacterium]